MKRLIIAALTVFSLSASAQSTNELPIGKPIPAANEQLKGVDGKTMSLSDAKKENGLLVMFSCNTCPFVVKNQALTLKTIRYAEEHNIGVAIINSNEARRKDDDSYKAMVKYAAGQNYDVPYLMDNKAKVADAFGATHTPEVFLFGRDGVLVYKGALSDNPSDPESSRAVYIYSAIDAMTKGLKPEPEVTKSIGCSIKR